MIATMLPMPLPGNLSLPEGQHVAAVVTSGWRWNYLVGGLPFLSAATTENPIVRESVPIRKQQYDTANTPGEQSLEGWWLRSQATFHGGAGQRYNDPTGYTGFSSDSTPLTKFWASRNVDVWTQGKVTLLPNVTADDTFADAIDMTEIAFLGGKPAVFGILSNGSFFYRSATHSQVATVTGATQPLQAAVSDGSRVYVASTEGVWSCPVPVADTTPFTAWTKIYNLTLAAGTNVRMGFVKQRIMLGAGPGVYEIVPSPASPPATLPSAKYTALDTNWQWLSFTESGAAIYAVGNNGVRGSIVKFALASDGSIPVLSGAAVAMQLPAGEIPYSAIGYMGSFLGVGTNKGARVAVADSAGGLSYGPLLFNTSHPILAWSARDRFLYCGVGQGVDGDSGVYRIDLSNQSADLQFAYATDANYPGDGDAVQVVSHMGDLLVYGTDQALYVQQANTVADSGYLLTSRIRYSTLEPKLYKFVKARGPALAGTFSFQVYDEGDHPAGTFNYPTGRSPGEIDAAISQPTSPQDFLSIKFLFGASSTPGVGPEFWGYQLKALPGATRQRMLQLPLYCFDWERDAKGQRRGGKGSALRRLSELESLERAGDSVVLQDLDTKITTNVVIDQVSFKQTSPPPYAEGLGGVITLTLRTV